MQSAFAAADPQHKLAIVLANTITEASGGRLIIDIEQGGAIVPAGEEFDGVRTGALEIAFSANMYNKHLHSAAPSLSSVSGGLSSIQRMFWFEYGGGLELANELYAPHGITYIGYIALPGEDWAYTKEPLKTVDDLKKLKMRTAGDGGEILARLGAATVFMPGGELYESMQRGVINAFEYGAANEAWENGFHEVFNHVYLSTSRAPSDENSVVVGTETFNALPNDLKLIVETVVLEAADNYYGPTIMKDAQSLQNIRDYGCTVEPLPKEIEDAFLAEAEKFYDEAMAKEDDLYRRIMESQREFKEYCILKQLSG
jgi:TRAP-type mannitol/chloroaromatic compound transport system substrate-binding protein